MAKELPYFQFEPAEYLAGSVQFCSLAAQGLFVNIMTIYWQRNCELTVDQINNRFNKPELLKELIDHQIVKIISSKNDGALKQIEITFLKRSHKKHTTIAKKNSVNGKRSAEKKRLKRSDSEGLKYVNDRSTTVTTIVEDSFNESSTIREDKIRVDKSRENKVTTHPLCLWIQKDLPHVSKLKTQLTDKQAETLLKKYDKKLLHQVLEDMDNYAPLLKKYSNVNKTITGWIRYREQNSSAKQPYNISTSEPPKGQKYDETTNLYSEFQ